MKKIKRLLLVLVMSLLSLFTVFGAAACGSTGKPNGETADTAIAFKEGVSIPTEVDIYDEVYFRNFIVVNDDADYFLYVSYYDTVNGQQVTNKKQTSLVYQFQMEGEYTFKIEQVLGDKISSVSCTIKVQPQAPEISSPIMGATSVGAVKTYSEIVMMTQVLITPSSLVDKVQFLSYDFESKVEGVENETDVALDASATEFTFAKEGVYTFDVKIENEKGEATAQLSVRNYNEDNYEARVELTYNPQERILNWEAIENATAYRVWVEDRDYVDVTEPSFSFADEMVYPDGEYNLKIAPVFNGTVYKGAAIEKLLPVGRVRTPLILSKDMDIVTWDERYFVEEYYVIEGDKEYCYEGATFEHLVQGAYKVNEQINIQVYGKFDDGTVTETAEIQLVSGDVATTTLSAINAKDGVASGVEAITFGGMDGNTWFLTEWVGQNAPNYGIRVESLSSNWDGSYTIKKDAEGNPYGAEYTPGGMMLTNSSEKSWTDMYLYRGYNTTQYQRGAVGDPDRLGLYRYKKDVHYIQIVGYEAVENSESSDAKITAYLFTIDQAGTLTLVTKTSGTATCATHCLEGGQYARLYGNIVVPLQENNPKEVTFTYAKPATSLDKLIYNISDSYAYKTQLIELCEVTEPEAYEALPNRVLTTISEPPVVNPDDGNEGGGESGGEDEDTIVTPDGDYTELSEKVTLGQIDVDANGAATNVESLVFDNLAGDTWFMVQFTGNNAPNFAVRSTEKFAAWGEATVGNNAGMLITNSSYENQRSLNIYRGTKTDSTTRRIRIDGTMGVGPGNECFVASKNYIMIIGYAQNADVSTSADLTCYIFEIDANGAIKLTFSASATATYAYNALTGTKAVIYGNINVGTAEADDEWNSVSFTYATPANSLYNLMQGVADTYRYKNAIIELLDVTEPPTVGPDGGEGGEGGEVGGEEKPESPYTELSESTTLNKIETDGAGGATNVQSVAFDGLDGDTWFMVQFTGNNAPNFAVRSTEQFATWGEATVGNNAGMFITNSSYENQRSINLYRGSDMNSGTRRARIDGTMGVGIGNECFNASKSYIMIIGYTQNASVTTSADLTCYVFEINEDGTLTLVLEKTATATYAYNALTGSKAVIYGNIGVTDNQLGPDSVTFTYAAPKATLEELIAGVADTYQHKTAIVDLLDLTIGEGGEPDGGEGGESGEDGEEGGETEPSYTELSEATTLNKIETDGAGGATNVQSVAFDGLDGDTWFMVQFTGNNAPNFAVRSTEQFATWGEATVGNNAGMFITNSSYENQRSINLYRGSDMNSGTRRARIDGTMGVGIGNECFNASKSYIMIIGYTQNASVTTSADLTCYVFEINEDGTLTLVLEKTATATYAYNALTGSKAVIYGNIGVTDNQLGPDSVTFTYATPKATLEELIAGVADTYQYKAALKTSLNLS